MGVEQIFEVANEAWTKLESSLGQSQLPESLFHYTGSSAALVGMIENREIWMTPFNDLNDPSEVVMKLKSLNRIFQWYKADKIFQV